MCLVGFCGAIPLTFDGGIYLYKLMDWYTCVQSLSILAAIEVCVTLWVFGAGRLRLVFISC